MHDQNRSASASTTPATRPRRSASSWAQRCLRVGLTASLLAALAYLGPSGCKPVDLSGGTPPIDTSTAHDSAYLSVTNHVDIDPDSLQFVLFPGTAVDFTNAVGEVKLSWVAHDSTVTMLVPVGTWKVAYANKAGALVAMRDLGANGGTWVASTFLKGQAYTLIVSSDAQEDIVWDPSYVTEPPIR